MLYNRHNTYFNLIIDSGDEYGQVDLMTTGEDVDEWLWSAEKILCEHSHPVFIVILQSIIKEPHEGSMYLVSNQQSCQKQTMIACISWLRNPLHSSRGMAYPVVKFPSIGTSAVIMYS